MAPLRSVVLIAAVAAVATLGYILSLPPNVHWLHLLATYRFIHGYWVSKAFGSASRYYFASLSHEFSAVCTKEPNELCPRDASALATSTWPCVIRGAFQKTRAVKTVLEHLDGEFQNQFAPCPEETPLGLGWETKPCLNVSFTERLRRLDPNHVSSKSFQVFTKVLSEGRMAREEDMLRNRLGTRPEIVGLFEHSSIWPHISVFMNRNESSVPFFHAHPDFFAVWNVFGAKEWSMLPPAFIPETEAVWSGLSLMAVKEPDTSCIVKVVLKPGDVLVVPSWWLHKTRLINDSCDLEHGSLCHLGYNQHFALKGSVAGQMLALSEKFFGLSAGYQYLDMFAPSKAFFDAIKASLI